MAITIQCPQCGSNRLYKDGLRYTNGGTSVQRWLCRECYYRFSEKKPLQRNPNCHINTESAYLSKRQVCELLTEESKNLDTAANQETTAGEVKTTSANAKGSIVQFAWYMHKEGYKSSTMKGRQECLQNLINLGANLSDPEDVKRLIADQKWGDGYKKNTVLSYTTYLAMLGKTWNPPHYKRPDTLPFIPLESELDQLISSTGKKVSTFLAILKETGADPGETQPLRWIDINNNQKTITLNHPVKGHKARIISVSKELIDRINTLPKTQETIFKANIQSITRNYSNQRQTTALKLNNPRLRKITFTTFRHWKATMEYHKTKDILWVMRLLGHHSLKTTLIYIDLETALFKESNDEFTVKIAETLNEACKLLEVGFEYVTDMEGKKVFKKRK